MTNIHFLNDIFPRLPSDLIAQMQARYPNIRLQPEADFVPLTECPVCMIVGLTGTGKSTTLAKLKDMRQAGELTYADDIPVRRELADWVVIPTTQIISGQAVSPVKGRELRFAATRKFTRELDPGGVAAVFSWLYYGGDTSIPLVSEGVRGPVEIRYVLEHFPKWRVFELWVPPLVRLQRLSGRSDAFDQVAKGNVDLTFLPLEDQAEAQSLLAQGLILPQAVRTMAAEVQNYGYQPYDAENHTERYRYLNIEQTPPEQSAAEISRFIREMSA